jgi:hypothetical protein
MRRLLVLTVMLLAAVPAVAQKRPPGYAAAATQFEALTVEQRLRLQVLLTAAGYWPAVPNVNFNGRLFEAITTFQRESNYYPNGQIDQMQSRHLADFANYPDLPHGSLFPLAHKHCCSSHLWGHCRPCENHEES